MKKLIRDFFEYKWKYILQEIVQVFSKPSKVNYFLFIVHSESENWILGAKAKRLSHNFKEESEVLFTQNFKNIPKAKGYFFLHQKYYARALRYNPHLKNAKCIVMFTHPEWSKFYSKSHALYTLKNANRIVCLNSSVASELNNIGLPKDKMVIYHLASNPDMFSPKEQRIGKTVGFCNYYSMRKNPELIYSLILKMQDVKFILIGQNWQNYPKFKELLEADNFTYYGDLDYSQYPDLYKQMDVFVSPSFLEGGPVPLLEAMLSNVVPVVSKTGFGPDIIRHGENGYVFDPHKDSIKHVIGLVRKALLLKGDVRKDVVNYSWEKYGEKIYQLYTSRAIPN